MSHCYKTRCTTLAMALRALPRRRRSLPMADIQRAVVARRLRLMALGQCSAAQRRAYLRGQAYTAVDRARLRVTTLAHSEREDTMASAHLCFARLREGVATLDQHTVLNTQLKIAMGIEDSGIVRGLRGHLQAALDAMDAISDRATTAGQWRPVQLTFAEIDTISEAIFLHDHQLRHVSARELSTIARKLIARTQSTGGTAVLTDMTSLPLQAV